MRLKTIFKEFIEDKKIDVVCSTIETLENRYVIINRYYDNCDIEIIDKQSVRLFQKYLLEECDYSVTHTNRIVGLLKQIVKFAYEQNYINNNMISSIGNIKKQTKIKKEKVIWNIVQYNEFKSNIEDLRDNLVFDMLFYLGLRKGELLSLKWKEICFANMTVRILSTASRRKGVGQVVTPPKTINSNRSLSINETLYISLSNYYQYLRKTYGSCIDGWFVVGDEKMMSFTSLQRLLDKYLEKTPLSKITLHGFRHSHATMLFGLTKDIKAISLHLGHESVEVTINTYIHSTDKAQKELAELVEDNLQVQNKSKLEICRRMIEKLLTKEMMNNGYSNSEMECLFNAYKYVQSEMIIS